MLDDQVEIERWNDLIRTNHYLRSSNVVGKALRCVVEVAGKWAALLSFSSAAYHLKRHATAALAGKHGSAGSASNCSLPTTAC
ncbi:MAG: hypothetical protein J6386_07620 [Candidatus Synoicihabitans palmerolidicus]|nr:hypothetical protein [Candidatus Synoicihabitans palmerolidicus]